MKTFFPAFFLVLARLAFAASDAVRVDQVGYLPNETKFAMVVNAEAKDGFDVRRVSDGISVFRGSLSPEISDAASNDKIRMADFSAVSTPGAYYLDVAGVGSSFNFHIGADAFAGAYRTVLRGFYGQRCGTAVDMGIVDGVEYKHTVCHSGATAANDLPATFHASSGRTGTRASGKGWHDAGDFGKYVVNSGVSTAQLLWAWEWYGDRLAAISSGIPESGNSVPDILDEARWNLEWMLSMQDTDGGVWHKLTSAGWTWDKMPEEDNAGTRYIIGSGLAPYKVSAATADFAAAMAIAARIYIPYDPQFAASCLKAAERAWSWASANPSSLYRHNPPGVETGAYEDIDPSDEMLWAAAELFATTGKSIYNGYVIKNAPAGALLRAEDRPQDWPTVLNLGLWAYYFSKQPTADQALRRRIEDDTLAAGIAISAWTQGSGNGYKVSLRRGHYTWGSNAVVANFGVLLLAADRMRPDPAFSNAALNNLHYLLGRNTHNTSFVSHVGSRPYLHPHHRPSMCAQYKDLAPWPGLLTGGPMTDYPEKDDNSGLAAIPPTWPAKRWLDKSASYKSNEVSINGNAPLVFLLAATLPRVAAAPAR